MSQSNNDNRAPIETFPYGQVEAAVWAQEREQDGRSFIQHSVRIQKRYRDKNGVWHSTDYYFPSDLPDIQIAAGEAYKFIRDRKRSRNGSTTDHAAATPDADE